MQKDIVLSYEVFDSVKELCESDATLLQKAKETVQTAYAPYSNFLVGAAALLSNSEIITGTNQENASYPVGICAERVLLSAAAVLHSNIPIQTLAISYKNTHGESNRPISPCGLCRQSLLEYEQRMKHPIRIILAGETGSIYILPNAASLLPLNFSGDSLL